MHVCIILLAFIVLRKGLLKVSWLFLQCSLPVTNKTVVLLFWVDLGKNHYYFFYFHDKQRIFVTVLVVAIKRARCTSDNV